MLAILIPITVTQVQLIDLLWRTVVGIMFFKVNKVNTWDAKTNLFVVRRPALYPSNE